jgi:hypothetical protein
VPEKVKRARDGEEEGLEREKKVKDWRGMDWRWIPGKK